MNTTELLNTNVTKLYEVIDDYIALAVEGVIIPLIAFLGLIGNILSIIVLQSKGINMKVRIVWMVLVYTSMNESIKLKP